jgi:hypothetical protein
MPTKRSLDIGPIELQPRVIVYATIIQLSTFAFLNLGGIPWTGDRFVTLITVSLGPMLALALAHMFSEILDHDIRGLLFRDTLIQILRTNLQFLYVGAIPIVLALPTLLFGFYANTTINLIFLVGTISLFVWGAIGARLAGRSLKQQLVFGVAYGFIGCIIVAIELWIHH